MTQPPDNLLSRLFGSAPRTRPRQIVCRKAFVKQMVTRLSNIEQPVTLLLYVPQASRTPLRGRVLRFTFAKACPKRRRLLSGPRGLVRLVTPRDKIGASFGSSRVLVGACDHSVNGVLLSLSLPRFRTRTSGRTLEKEPWPLRGCPPRKSFAVDPRARSTTPRASAAVRLPNSQSPAMCSLHVANRIGFL